VSLLSPNRARSREWLRSILAFALALVGHAMMVGVLLIVSHLQFETPPFKPRPLGNAVVLRPLSAAQFTRNRGPKPPVPQVAQKAPKAPKDRPEAEKKPIPEQAPGQVVDVAPGNGELSPDAKFAAETNNRVKQETRAREQTAFYRNAMPTRTATKRIDGKGQDPIVEVATQAGNSGRGADDRPLKEASAPAALEIPRQKSQTELTLKVPATTGPGPVLANRTETEALQGNSERLNLALGPLGQGAEGSEGREGSPGAANLLPSPAVLDKVTGAAANDHLQDVDEGDGTFLNTREWKYASFFNRVKQSVGQHWNPNAQLRQRDPTLQIYGGRDRHTLLQVTLTDDGKLKDAWVEKSSGLDFLDLEAVQAFERAQPFPNPPPGLIAADQTVRFQFGFFFELSGRPGLRLFRGND